MVNNQELIDPYGADEDSSAVRQVREGRVLTALDDGIAWRHRREGALVVVRREVFASGDDADHRSAWRRHGVGCLDSVWRERWRDRDRVPGWIEARWVTESDRPSGLVAPDAVDWIRIEDQTGASETDVVLLYQHITVWCGRQSVTLTVRHDLRHDLDWAAVSATNAAWQRMSEQAGGSDG